MVTKWLNAGTKRSDCEYWTERNGVKRGKHSGDIDVATDWTNAILQRLERNPSMG